MTVAIRNVRSPMTSRWNDERVSSLVASEKAIAAAGDGPVGGGRMQAIREEEIAGASGRKPASAVFVPEEQVVFR